MHPMQVAFFRFLFGTLSLMPFMLYFGKSSFSTPRPMLHVIRGSILFCAISIWIFGLKLIPIATATLLTFTIPLFVLIMARIFLHEKVTLQLWLATLLGFCGTIIAFDPSDLEFNPLSLLMLLSSALFASLDIINKKFIVKESMLSMLFYSALVTTILSIYPAYIYWQTPELSDLVLLFILGAGSNFILYCLLKAFTLVEASAVAPYRYLELVLSGAVGYLLFQEIPGLCMLIGAIIIIPTTLYIAYAQIKLKSN
jgi:S-adenosylmethionine uptake transporter